MADNPLFGVVILVKEPNVYLAQRKHNARLTIVQITKLATNSDLTPNKGPCYAYACARCIC